MRRLWGVAMSNDRSTPDSWAWLVASALNFLRDDFKNRGKATGLIWSGRIVRWERRKASWLVLSVFLRHLDPITLHVGYWSRSGDFIPLGMAAVVSETGLCRRRCERAISHLKALGFVAVLPPRHLCNPLPYVGLRVIRAVTPSFFEWAGLAEHLDLVRSESIHQSQVEGGQP